MVIKARSLFDRSDSVDPSVGLDCREVDPKTGEFVYVTRTKQADKDGCDINKILARYVKTGQLPDLIRKDARYGDFASVPGYQESLEIISKAQEQFEALGARVRERFHNDPAEMLAFCSDPKNAKEMIELGLAVPAPQPQAVNTAPTQSGSAAEKTPTSGGAK